MFSVSNVIHIIIIFQGTLLTLYILFSNKKKLKSDSLLVTIMGTLSFQMLGLFLVSRNVATELFQSANCIYGFLYGPLLYLYNKSITRSDFRFRPIDFVHFLPATSILLGQLITKGGICEPRIYIGYAVHVLIYIFFCFLEVHRYKKVVKDNYSRLEWLNLGWLQWTFLMFFLIVVVDVVQFILFLSEIPSYPLEILVYLLILVAINLLYFNGFTLSGKLRGFSKEDLAFSTSIASVKRINMALEENQALIEKLEKHLDLTESFKNPNLTIGLLAQELEIPKRTLSELINDHYHQHFVDFINTYRINSARERLMNPPDPNETILEVLYEVGFNSKSSFNTAFKKKTGLTPSQFKDKYK
ncbi:helix-turn-helix domain-containing protein [Fulvivirgaceae bacterium BMA10]|uniref:Helix-turn-helix domain-containing protein n=1 Tax=Splendidivirga corallicola TaxID=3051826 RepID=A0ABT8KJL0_9BACT|nr:helix-turn-helix domain-containing protein [Fulvivirgaceae bacterium BMA10]